MKRHASVLVDWKVTSVWAVRDGAKIEWTQQLNTYALMLRRHGFWVDRLQIIAILRDWRSSEARKFPDSYPARQVLVIPIEMWTDEQCIAFIDARIEAHRAARETLPLCTDEERWGRPTTYAVMKNGNAKATKVCDTEAEAQAFIDERRSASPKAALEDWRIETRQGEFMRCTSYCSAAPFCEQFQNEQRGKLRLTPYG